MISGRPPGEELTPLQIEKVYADLMVDGGRYGRTLLPKTIRNVHAVLRRSLSDAERLGLIVPNPATGLAMVGAFAAMSPTGQAESSPRNCGLTTP